MTSMMPMTSVSTLPTNRTPLALARLLTKPEHDLADLRYGDVSGGAPSEHVGSALKVAYSRRNHYIRGAPMLIIQRMPNRSVHIPNSSPQACFASGTSICAPSESFCQ